MQEIFPLVDLVTWNKEPTEPQRTSSGWYVEVCKGLTARISQSRDGIICRIDPDNKSDVVQLGIGRTTSRLCNAIFIPFTDTALVMKADGLMIEGSSQTVVSGDLTVSSPAAASGDLTVSCQGPLTITVLDHYMSKHCNLPWFEPLDRSIFKRAPAGWCSWYYYYLDITEDEVKKNTDWLEKNLKDFGCEYVQIDDGWQGRGEGLGDNRDWFVTSQRDFPHGMKVMADYIQAKGFKPGIWCIPMTQSDKSLYDRYPRMFIHRNDGTSPGENFDLHPDDRQPFQWPGLYHIDATSEEAEHYLHRLFDMLCNDWGYEYVKTDATALVPVVHDKYRMNLANPCLDGGRAYRKSVSMMKQVMGKERFLLNCACGLAFETFGISEGMRTGGDVSLNWKGMLQGIQCSMQWLFLNTIAFYTDPDAVCVREPLPFDQAKVWATLLGITGQLLMASDKMYELSDNRVALLKKIFPVADIHPMELYSLPLNHMPGIFDLKINIPAVGEWDVAAIFNWDEGSPKGVEIDPAKLGLADGSWICTDGWTGDLLQNGNGALHILVPQSSCRVIVYWPDQGRPQFVGTNRHLSQGADDIEALDWNDETLELSGVSNIVANHPYEIRIFVPEEFQVSSENVEESGRMLRLMIAGDSNKQVDWAVTFKKVEGVFYGNDRASRT